MNGMFNYQTPMAAQEQFLNDRMLPNSQMSQLPLLNQVAAMGMNPGTLLGTGIGRLFGGRTSDEVENEAMKEIFAGANAQTEDPVERMAIAAKAMRQRGLEGRAIQLEQEAAKLQQTRAATRKTELGLQQEESLRRELAELGPEATPEEIESVVLKYGDPDKIITAMSTRQARTADREARIDVAKQRHQERLDIARENNASRQEIAQMNRDFQQQVAQERRQDRFDLEQQRNEDRRERAREADGRRVLSGNLQKAEDDDFEAIDGARGVVADIQPIIKNLEEGKLNLSGFNNMQFKVKAAIGSNDPEVLAYQELERNLTRFVNESLRLNKGVQTDGDAVRSANEVQAAFSKNNTKATLAALRELEKINGRAVANREKQIDRRRESQRLTPIFSGQSQQGSGSSGNAASTDAFSAADAIINQGR